MSEQHVNIKQKTRETKVTNTESYIFLLFCLLYLLLIFGFIFYLYNFFGSLYLWLARPTQT